MLTKFKNTAKKWKYAMENFTLGLILAPVWSNHLGKTQQTVAIEEMENYDFDLKGANLKIPKKTTDNVIKSNKCNQCDYASYQAGDLRRHLKTHLGEKSSKCNLCDYATYHAGDLKALQSM